ncbi:MAG: kelch repeat-containing protein, partial [Bacteroidota bacterium]
KGTWSTLENGLPTERAGNFTVLYGQEILVLGGESFNQTPAHSEVEALNVKTHTWRTLSPMKQGRHGTGAILHEGKVCVASGCGNRGGEPELKTMEYLSF